MRYEKKNEPLAPRHVFYWRIVRNFIIVSGIIGIVLAVGTIGYHYSTEEPTPWLDAFHNASMIISGMGPIIVDNLTDEGKIFSSLYALFSGVIFIGGMGFILAPGLHRIFHGLHIEHT